MAHLTKREREKIIGDYSLGIEHPEYIVSQKQDGGFLVRKRKKKPEPSMVIPVAKFPEPTPEPTPEPPKQEQKQIIDDISLDEICERLLEKMNKLRNTPPTPEPEPENVDETNLDIEPEEEIPIPTPQTPTPIPIPIRPQTPMPREYSSYRRVRLY